MRKHVGSIPESSDILDRSEAYNVNADVLKQVSDNKSQLRLVDDALVTVDTGLSVDETAELSALKALLLLELSWEYGLRLQNPLSALLHEARLFQQKSHHFCSAALCSLFNIPKGTEFPLLNTTLHLESSGVFYICRITGAVHVCRPGQSCNAMVLDPQHRDDGYTCDISCMFKSGIIDQMPPQRRDTQISYARLEKMTKAQNFKENVGLYEADGGEDEFFEDGGVSDEEGGEDKTKKKKPEAEQEDDSEVLAEGMDVENEVDEEEEAQDEVIEEVVPAKDGTGKTKKKDSTVLTEEQAILPEIPVLIKEMEPVVNGKRHTVDGVEPPSKRPKNGNTTFRLGYTIPEDPDERVAYFLKNLDKRAEEADRMIDVLTNYDTHLNIWLLQLHTHSEAAHGHIQRYERRNKYSAMSAVESNLRWTSYVLHHLPPRPDHFEPLPTVTYIEVVMKAWQTAVESPYIKYGDNKHFIPNFAKVCIAVLYQMASGGYIHDCSLTEDEFPSLPEQFEALRNFEITILLNAKKLHSCLVTNQLIDNVKAAVLRAPRVSKKQIAVGWRLLKECFSSAVHVYRSTLKTSLEQPDCNLETVYTTYIKSCVALRCRATVKNGRE
jgi:hypothetical protein